MVVRPVLCKIVSDFIDLDSFRIQLQPLLLVDEEFLDILSLIPLKLYHLAHFTVVDNGAIASY